MKELKFTHDDYYASFELLDSKSRSNDSDSNKPSLPRLYYEACSCASNCEVYYAGDLMNKNLLSWDDVHDIVDWIRTNISEDSGWNHKLKYAISSKNRLTFTINVKEENGRYVFDNIEFSIIVCHAHDMGAFRLPLNKDEAKQLANFFDDAYKTYALFEKGVLS